MSNIIYNLCASVNENAVNKSLSVLWQGLLSMTLVVLLVIAFICLTKKIADYTERRKNSFKKSCEKNHEKKLP